MEASPLVRLQNIVIEQFEKTALQVEGDDKMSRADQNSREVAIDLYKNSEDTLSYALEKAKKIFEEIVDITSLEVLLWESGVKSTLQELRHIERGIYGELEKVEEVAARIAAHVQLHDSDMVSSGPFLKQVRVLSQDFLSSEILETAKGKLVELMLGYQPICAAEEREGHMWILQREFKIHVASEWGALGDKHWYLCEPRLFSKGKAEKLRKQVNALYTAAVVEKERQVVEAKVSIKTLNPEMYAILEREITSLAEDAADLYIERSSSRSYSGGARAFGKLAIVRCFEAFVKRNYPAVVNTCLRYGADLNSLVEVACNSFAATVSSARRLFIESREHQEEIRLRVRLIADEGVEGEALDDIRESIETLDRIYITDLNCGSYATFRDAIELKVFLHFLKNEASDCAESKAKRCCRKISKSTESNLPQSAQGSGGCDELKGADCDQVRVMLGVLSREQAAGVLGGPWEGPLLLEEEIDSLRSKVNAYYVLEAPTKEDLFEYFKEAYCFLIKVKYGIEPSFQQLKEKILIDYERAQWRAKEKVESISHQYRKKYMIESTIADALKGHEKSLPSEWFAEKYKEALNKIKKEAELKGDHSLVLVLTPHFIEDARRHFEASL